MADTFFLLGEFLGKTPRRCRVIRQVNGEGHGSCWLVDAYPPIAGSGPGSAVILELLSPKMSLADVGRCGLGVRVAISRQPLDGDVFDSRDFEYLGPGELVGLNQVSKRAFPYD